MIQKIREAIRLLSTNFVLFSSIVLTVWLPASILLVYLRAHVFPQTAGGDELRILAQELRVSNLIEMAFGPLYVGALLYAASCLKQGLSVTYGEAMTHAARRSFKVFGTRIGTGLITLVGLIALIVPGIILAVRFSLIDSIVVLEGTEGAHARSLSAEMTRGRRWKIFGTMILSYTAVFIAMILISIVLALPFALIGQEENFLVSILSDCISNILLAIPTIALFLFYWDAKSASDDVE